EVYEKGVSDEPEGDQADDSNQDAASAEPVCKVPDDRACYSRGKGVCGLHPCDLVRLELCGNLRERVQRVREDQEIQLTGKDEQDDDNDQSGGPPSRAEVAGLLLIISGNIGDGVCSHLLRLLA